MCVCVCVSVGGGWGWGVGLGAGRVRRPAARPSEANKQARWVERKFCFISDAGNLMGRVAGIYSKANSPLPPPPTSREQ